MKHLLPTPATACFRGDFSVQADVLEAARLIADGQPLAIDNSFVYGVWGDATSTAFVRAVEVAKGREPGRKFGLSLKAEDFLGLVNRDSIHRGVWPLLEDATIFAERLGAIAFVRAPSKVNVLEKRGVPESVISQVGTTPIVQNWVPEGKANTQALLQKTERLGVVFPAVTSLNASGKPEIIDEPAAIAFAQEKKLGLLTDSQSPTLNFQGSFPIVEFTSDGIALIRTREHCIGRNLIRRLLADVPLYVPDASKAPSGLDISGLESLHGAELRLGLLEKLGWTATSSSLEPTSPGVPTLS